jgi:uncharacterized protein YacL
LATEGTAVTLKITRVMFIFACITMGLIWIEYLLGIRDDVLSSGWVNTWRLVGAFVGGVAGTIVLLGLRYITQELFERLFPAVIAIAIALGMGFGLAQYIIDFIPEDLVAQKDNLEVYLTSSLVLIFGFMGISLGLTRASNWESLLNAVKQRSVLHLNSKIIDTSALIDGRIYEISKTGFMDGTFIIPRFVLYELQHIADSSDLLRRTKGRRGLDILKEMQEDQSGVQIEILDDNPEESTEVDTKLVIIAKQFKSKIITTDFNLNKVAQIEGIEVLNINDLANSLKPAALPDESMDVKIVKEGKEPTQGVGYLDDGTMIVVDGGSDFVGRTVTVMVTSVLQTAAGRMIFTKIDKVISDDSRKAL